MKSKRVSFAVFSLILVLSVLMSCVTAYAASTAEVVFGNVEGKTGEEVTVPVTISSNPGIATFRFRITYAPDELEFVSAEKGEALTSGTLSSSVNEEGTAVTFLWFNTSNVKKNGVIVNLTFRILKDSDGVCDLPVIYSEDDMLNSYSRKVSYTVTEGSITVWREYDITGSVKSFGEGEATVKLFDGSTLIGETVTADGKYSFYGISAGEYTVEISKDGCVTYAQSINVTNGSTVFDFELNRVGDIDGDGRFTSKDVIMIKLYINGMTDTSYESVFDSNGDGTVNSDDAKYAALLVSNS